MNFYLIGIDHERASIDIREAAYWKRAEIAEFLNSQAEGRASLFYTCNRIEIYGIVKNLSEAGRIAESLKTRFNSLFSNSYTIFGEENVLRHLISLAAGLESQIKGELQIYNQIAAWLSQDNFPIELASLVHDALLAGHEIRSREGFSKPENNIAVLLYDRILSMEGQGDIVNIIVAGTGKIAELFASYKPEGVRVSFAARKNILQAGKLAKYAGGRAVLLKELPGALKSADILISATSSPHRIFDKTYFSKIAALREKELYIYDLAIPRDVVPEVKDINGIILENIDEVISNADFKSRREAEQISR